jgi:hypothetical protein
MLRSIAQSANLIFMIDVLSNFECVVSPGLLVYWGAAIQVLSGLYSVAAVAISEVVLPRSFW